MSILFAATYPEKVSSLILGSAFARWFPAPDYPCGPGAEVVYAAMHEIATDRWGQGATIDWFLPSRASSPRTRQALARFERMAISPSAFLRMIRMISEIDVRAALPAIRVPTLVIQRLGDRINPPFYGRYIASHIPGARYFEQPGDHVLRFAARRGTRRRCSSRSKTSSQRHRPRLNRPACSPRSCLPSGWETSRPRTTCAPTVAVCAKHPLTASSLRSTRPAKRSAAQPQSVPMPRLTASVASRNPHRRSRPRRRQHQRHLRRDRQAHRGARERWRDPGLPHRQGPGRRIRNLLRPPRLLSAGRVR